MLDEIRTHTYYIFNAKSIFILIYNNKLCILIINGSK